jgi:hypothetical protein
MESYSELNRAIETTLNDIGESADFKARFKALIANFYDKSYAQDDIESLIGLCDLEEDFDED